MTRYQSNSTTDNVFMNDKIVLKHFHLLDIMFHAAGFQNDCSIKIRAAPNGKETAS